MQTANAIKIGVWIVIAVAILIFGTRYFQGLALGGTKTIVAEFERVDGLIAGNPVQMRGVRIGNVSQITVDEDRAVVVVRMNVNNTVTIREGSQASLIGIAALGDMRIEIEPGPPDAAAVENGGYIESKVPIDLVGDITDAAGGYMETLEEILERINESMQNLSVTLDQGGDINATLASLKAMTGTMEELLRAESTHLSNTIRNFESVSSNLDSLTSTRGDSTVVAGLNRSLDHLDKTLAQTESLTANLDSILARMNRGEGTLGKLATDESLYNSLDSVSINMSRLLEDFRKDPKKYLRNVKISMF